MELFLHPWYMVAGGALISSPIIIHLINRMRFKRVRWAAMEFLLKSQKRNRRRLIIEQMILLLLRILLVLLIAFLVARFIGGALGNTGQGTKHVVILDDTPSMADRWGDKADKQTSFAVAKNQIKQVAHQAALANSAQEMQIYLLSDLLGRFKVTDEALAVLGTKAVPADVLAKLRPLKDDALDREHFLEELKKLLGEEDLKRYEIALLRETDASKPKYDHRLDSRSDEEIGKALDLLQPQALHVDPVVGVRKARDLFNASAQGQKVLHIVSDFRDADWASSAGLKELNTEIDKLIETGVNVSLLDTGHPFRSETRDIILNHDNLAITDFRAESRIAAEGVPLEFSVKVHNFGSKDEKSFLNVYIDGSKDRDFTASVPLENLPANSETVQKFTLLFQKKKPGKEYLLVSAQLNQEESGLQMDNVRDLVVDVRKKIPALIVDGAGREGQKPGGDSFHLEIGLLGSRAYEAEYKTLEELAGLNLDDYPSIWFLNVPEIRHKAVVDKLQKYVADGGSIAWFMGDKVSSVFYNKVLHEDAKGLFPVKLAARYTEALTPEEREFRKQRDPQPKILFRDKDHPIVKEGLYPQRLAFQSLLIDRYWPTLPRSQWNPETETEKVEEVITLPNRNSIDAYKTRAQELAREAVERTEALAKIDESFKKYEAPMKNYRRKMTEALGTDLLFSVVAVVDRMLEDPGEPKNPDRPSMPELWANIVMKTLHGQLKDFRDTLLYGDPLVVTRRYGKGRVAVCLTTAGTSSRWNEWGAGGPVQWSYPVFIGDLQRYLTSESAELNRIVSAAAGITLEWDAEKYRSDAGYSFWPQPDLEGKKAEGTAEARPGKQTRKDVAMTVKENRLPSGDMSRRLQFRFNEAREPGIYTFEFKPVDEKLPSEFRSYAFNVDAVAESNLKRAGSDKLKREVKTTSNKAGKLTLLAPGDDMTAFKNREPDASESPWLYLLFILVLVIEQALAVHLSFHMKPGEQAAAAPARPQPAAA